MECPALNVEVAGRHMADNYIIINVLAGRNSNGPVLEEIPAMRNSDGSFTILSSPGLTLNLAKGDTLVLHADASFDVVHRGGNFCIHIYADFLDKDDISKVEQLIQAQLGGALDGIFRGNLAFSIPSTNGLENINRVFDRVREILKSEYYYSNIYLNPNDPEDETLSNWWVD